MECSHAAGQALPQPDQATEVALGEGESVGRRDVAKDSTDQMRANTLQNLLADPENRTDYQRGVFQDSELATALQTLKTLPNGRAELHRLMKARGYFRDTFNGTSTPEATAADRRQTRPGGRPQSLDHAAAASSSEHPPPASTSTATSQEQRWKALRERTTCVKCGRLGHWLGDPEC